MKGNYFKLLFLNLILASSQIIYGQASYANFDWAVKAGGTLQDYVSSIAVDNQGYSYVTGYFRGTATFGNLSVTAEGNENFFVAKLNPAGQYLWVSKAVVNDAGQDYQNQITVDQSGNIYITGNFRNGSVTFGTTTFSNNAYSTDLFVAKLNASGEFLWARHASSSFESSWAVAKAITTDTAGNIFLVGYFKGTYSVTFGSSQFSGSDDGFIVKLNPQGDFVWVANPSNINGGNPFSMDIAVDEFSNSYVTGNFNEPATFGSTTLAASGGDNDIFITKLNSEGQFLWAVMASSPDQDSGNGIALDSAGNIYITGEFMGTANFGNSTISSSGARDIFVAKYTPQGQNLWAVQAGGTGFDESRELETDPAGNIFIAGVLNSFTANFGTAVVQVSGTSESYIAKLNPGGQFTEVGKVDENSIMGMGSDPAGRLYITGLLGGPATFGNTTLTQSGGGDLYIAKLSENLLGIALAGYSNFRVYPNPCTDILRIEGISHNDAVYSIYDISGKLIDQHVKVNQDNIDISRLEKGIYFLQIETMTTSRSVKFIKN